MGRGMQYGNKLKEFGKEATSLYGCIAVRGLAR